MKEVSPLPVKQTFLCMLILLTHTSCSTQNKQPSCAQREWTHDLRSQGGGYLWFLGSGQSRSEKESMSIAEGEAIHRLMLECKHPHKNARFVERCSDDINGTYKSFARISQTVSECSNTVSSSKNVNQSLEKLGSQYIQNHLFKDDLCKNIDSEECLRYGINLNKADDKKSVKYFYEACTKGNSLACYYSGVTIAETDTVAGQHLLERACAMGFNNACFNSIPITAKSTNDLASLSEEIGLNYYQVQKKYLFSLEPKEGYVEKYCAGSNLCNIFFNRVPDIFVENPSLELSKSTYVAFNPPLPNSKGNAYFYFVFHKGKIVSSLKIFQFSNDFLPIQYLNDLQKNLKQKNINYKRYQGSRGPSNQIVDYSNKSIQGNIVTVPRSEIAPTIILEEWVPNLE